MPISKDTILNKEESFINKLQYLVWTHIVGPLHSLYRSHHMVYRVLKKPTYCG